MLTGLVLYVFESTEIICPRTFIVWNCQFRFEGQYTLTSCNLYEVHSNTLRLSTTEHSLYEIANLDMMGNVF